MNAVSTKYYKDHKLIPQTAKAISSQSCHLCGLTSKDYQNHFHSSKQTFEALKPLGFAPLHAGKNSRECLVKSAFRKKAMKTTGKKDKATLKAAEEIICEKLREAIGVRLFEPEPAKKGNSNTGQNLKLVTKHPSKTAPILDCSEELLFVTHEVLGQLESTEKQNVETFQQLSERAFDLFIKEFGEFSQMSPSLHRALQHGGEFMSDYQGDGFTIGELSECAQEALNAPTKTDVSRFSFRGSHVAQNLQTFERNWMFSDPNTLEYDV